MSKKFTEIVGNPLDAGNICILNLIHYFNVTVVQEQWRGRLGIHQSSEESPERQQFTIQ